jgi:uncharacterized protein YndB with AHSA1/START domain
MTEKTNPIGVGSEVVLRRVFDAPRELVFRAWTEAEHLARWWGPEGFTNPVCELDARPGGAIRIDMTAPDGSVFPMGGEVKEVTPPSRFVFTSTAFDGGLENLNTVTFDEEGSKTHVTITALIVEASPEYLEALSGMEEGWSQSLDRLAALLAAGL